MIKLRPATNKTNMAANNVFVPLGALENSFQINTPQMAETRVAPCPRPYATAVPACPDAIILNDIPTHQMMPPKMPIKCNFIVPIVKYIEYFTGWPLNGLYINIVFQRKFEIRMPIEKMKTAV